METMNKTENLIELLKSDKNSPLVLFKENIPTDDLSYLTHWFSYLDYSRNSIDIVADLMGSYGFDVEKIESLYVFQNQLKEYIEKCHNDVLDKVDFEPRLEKYVHTFSESEQENIKKLIVVHLYKNVHKNDKFNTLLEMATEFNIDRHFVFALSEDHKLFQDKIIEIDKSSLHKDDPWHLRDIYFNPTIFNVFANIEANQEELVILRGSSVIQLFSLADEEQLSMIETKDEELNDSFDNEDDLLDDFVDSSIEDLLKDELDIHETNQFEEEVINEEIDDSDQKPYKDNLEYLYQEHLYFKSLIALKEMQNDDLRYNEMEDERKVHLLNQKIQKQRYSCDAKLERSKKNGFVPRLEKLATRLKLSDFEKNVLKVLVTSSVFIEANKGYSSYDRTNVKEVIFLLIKDQVEQITAKKYFQKNAKLFKSGLLHIEQMDSLNSSIYESSIMIDSRLLEHITGEEFNITEHIEGSFLYNSSIKIDNVKLPGELKERVMSTIDNFPTFLKAKKNLDFSEIVEYGNSLVMLFVGKSGTGKTMLANAVANSLKKKILLVNLKSMSQMRGLSNEEQIFSVLFREARMNDAILFFDESEEILEHRINDLLIEIEKHEGIVIFATNASFLIDEAMRRRINLIMNLPDPGPRLRKDIWDIHLPKKVSLAADVDLEQIARRYELNGGLIKNAVFSALAQAVNRSGEDELELKMTDLEYGAKEQLHNKLFMSNLERLKIPSLGMDKIVLPEKTEEMIKEIVNIEKSWKLLESEWGFSEVFPEHKGVSVLLHGPSGTGKTATAESIAYEMGRKLKIVNYSQILSMYVGGTEKALEALFEEVADNDSILLFDEADALFAQRTGVAGANDRYANVETDVLLSLIERYNTFTILTTNYISNIDKAFFRRMSYIIEFKNPDKDERYKIWKLLIPSKMPLAKDVNLKDLADKFEFTGGDIKNCIIRVATHKAVQMKKDICISQENLINICNEVKKNKSNGAKVIGFKN